MSAVLGIRYEDDRAWIDVCDDDGVHSVALDPHDAITTGQALLEYGERAAATLRKPYGPASPEIQHNAR